MMIHLFIPETPTDLHTNGAMNPNHGTGARLNIGCEDQIGVEKNERKKEMI
jgi:hypothetical protein